MICGFPASKIRITSLSASVWLQCQALIFWLFLRTAIHHNDKSTEMYDNRRSTALHYSMLLSVMCHVSCGLRQRHYRIIRCTLEGFTKATCPLLPTNESIVFEQTLRARTTINHNTLIRGCPLLITPGQCAEFIYKESEDLADLQAITPPSENVLRLHLSLWSVSKSPQSRHENYLQLTIGQE